jgi:hypothetical protein
LLGLDDHKNRDIVFSIIKAAFNMKFFFEKVTLGATTQTGSSLSIMSKEGLFAALKLAADNRSGRRLSMDEFKKSIQNMKKNHNPNTHKSAKKTKFADK